MHDGGLKDCPLDRTGSTAVERCRGLSGWWSGIVQKGVVPFVADSAIDLAGTVLCGVFGTEAVEAEISSLHFRYSLFTLQRLDGHLLLHGICVHRRGKGH